MLRSSSRKSLGFVAVVMVEKRPLKATKRETQERRNKCIMASRKKRTNRRQTIFNDSKLYAAVALSSYWLIDERQANLINYSKSLNSSKFFALGKKLRVSKKIGLLCRKREAIRYHAAKNVSYTWALQN